MDEPDPVNPLPLDDPDIQALAENWIHLSPLQKKVILWRVSLMAIRERAARFILSILTKEKKP